MLILLILSTLPNQVRKIGYESTTEIYSLPVDSSYGISRSYALTVGVVEMGGLLC